MANETLSLILFISRDVRECDSGHAAKARQGIEPVEERWELEEG